MRFPPVGVSGGGGLATQLEWSLPGAPDKKGSPEIPSTGTSLTFASLKKQELLCL